MATALNKVEWALNSVIDPTTGQPNRRTTGLTANEKNQGFVPAGVRPSRQGINTVLYELAKWTEFLKEDLIPFNDLDRLYLQNVKNGVNLQAGAFWSDSSSMSFDLDKIDVIVVNPSVPDESFPVTNQSGVVSYDNEFSFTGGGLNTYASTISNVFLHLFIVAKGFPSSIQARFATDTDPAGSNVLAAMAVNNFTHLRKIAVVPYINNGGRKFADLTYGADDYILYGEEQTSFENSNNTSSDTDVNFSVKLGVPNTVNAAPNADCKVKLYLRGDSVSTDIATVKDNYVTASPNRPEGTIRVYNNDVCSLTHEMNANSSLLFFKSATATFNVVVNYTCLGYKNPVVDGEGNS